MIDCFKIQEKFWKIIGIHHDRSKNMYLLIYSNVIVFIFIFGYDMISTFNFYFIPRQLDLFIEELLLYFTMVVVFSKDLTLIVMKDKVKRVLQILDSDLFNSNNEEEQLILHKANKFNKNCWKYLFIVSYVCHLTHVTSPVIFHFLLSVKLEPPVSGYNFFSENTTQRFIYPIYLYQTVGMHLHVLSNINIDTFFLGLMVFVIAHLDILANKMANVTKLTISRKSARGKLRETSKREVNEHEYILQLNKILVYYNDVIEFCALIEDIFSIAVFMQCNFASGLICVCLFRFTLPCTLQYYIFLSSYVAIMTVQVLVPCYFGSKIEEKSFDLSRAIYSCDWTPRSRQFKSSMTIVFERASRPLSITGLKMFPLSLVTFTSVINTAYSFFTLLRNMQTKD